METIKGHLASILARRWWLLLLRGLIAIAFGVVSWV
ncbi:MAG: HdeD family acid-resistance protein, partial [Gammaproteobacteria bacterium]